MNNLIKTIKSTVADNPQLPFSVYASIKEQNLLNVPVVKPLLIAVLDGDKELGKKGEITCTAGDFIFLSNSPAINMRNIPKGKEYFALLVEFELQDFEGLKISALNKQNYCIGEITPTLKNCLQQFVEWSVWAPKALWPIRRKEIIQLMCHMGHTEILAMVANPNIGHKLHSLISEQPSEDLPMQRLCEQLAMSESTLRRKLKIEGTTVQDIKDQVKLGLGLHLLQTTDDPIGFIAEKCGYQSQSRFTDRFKGRFGLTPSELRKTRMTD
ncbi:MAG: helix-turn-helix transcriptional regulator [Pseudomonadales bacterium]|nr:helix-turn-helix transcriptional regulator [Pseudomonadales bacterium]